MEETIAFQSDKVFVTPIDDQYHSKVNKKNTRKDYTEDFGFAYDTKDLQIMINDMVKDCCLEAEEDIEESFSLSTVANSPLDRVFPQISSEFLLKEHNKLKTEEIMREGNTFLHKLQSIKPLKTGKTFKFSKFLKKNWRNKLTVFKEVLTKKIISKVNFYFKNINNNFKNHFLHEDNRYSPMIRKSNFKINFFRRKFFN
jgi:hypothetical protein